MKKNNLYEKMRLEIIDKKIFNQVKDYAFEYADGSLERNVYPTEEAIINLRKFNEDFPEQMTDPSKILSLLNKYGSPGTVSQTGGRYFGFVSGGVIPIGLAAKWLTDFWDQSTALYVTSPIVSKLEIIVENWLKQMFGLSEKTVAGFVSGSSMAIMCGLAAARFRIYDRLGWNINEKGLIGAPQIRIILGKHAHAAVLKSITLLGFGKEIIEWVEVDNQGRIIPEQIPELDEKTILILQAGNVNSGSFDSFSEICEKANAANSWVHIDGAFGLWAACSEKLKYLTKGIEKGNSWSVDGHKTLNTPYDSGVVLCNDKEALISALQATGSYIVYGDNRDGMLYTPEMSRRARAVELWAILKYLGKEGVDSLVLGLHKRALQLAKELLEKEFNILNEVVFNQVLVACEDDEQTEKLLTKVQELNECWCGSSQWFGKKAIRISVCSWVTSKEDITRSVESFVRARDLVRHKN